MTAAATGPEFDPRYDPRFQRGWSGGEADGAGQDEPAARAPRAATGRPPEPEPEPAAVPVDADSSEAVSGAAPDAARDAAPDAAPGAAMETVHAGSLPTGDDDEADRIMRVAFGVAWAATALALAVGAWSIWIIVSQDPFAGPSGAPAEEAMRMFAYLAGPSALMAGVAGTVILVVVDGMRRARRLRRGPHRDAATPTDGLGA